MPAKSPSDFSQALYGPRDQKPFGSIEWCIQTVNILRIRWEKMNIQEREFLDIVQELEEARAWKKIPPDSPYGTKDKMLLAEIGVSSKTALTRLRMIHAASQTTGETLSWGGTRRSSCKLQLETCAMRALKNGISAPSQRCLDLLARDYPALHQDVLAGRKSIHKASVEAGIKKKKIDIEVDPAQAAKKIAESMTPEQIEELKRHLSS